jgi:outer membrane protein TolC
MKKKIISVMLILMFIMSFPVYGSSEEVQQEELTLSIEEAVEKGITNSLTMEQVKNQADIAALVSKNAMESKNDIYNAQNELSNAASDLSSGRTEIYSSMDQLDSAQAALDNGIAPMDIPVKNPSTGEVVLTIPKGSPLTDANIIAAVQAQLDENRARINGALEDLDEGTQEYLSSKTKYDLALQFAMTSVASKLSTSTISSLEPAPLADLVAEMADIQDRVTSYSVNIYKNQIALQIQNSYYEAQRHNKLLEAKDKAMERGKLQYEYADFAYQVGAKSKDDRNLAKLYYDGAVMTYELQVKDCNNAMINLKKNLNIPLDTKLKLTEESESIKLPFNLTQGINSGLRTRLEIKKANAQVELYKDLKTAVNRSYYKSSDNEYKEADLLIEKADLALKDTQLQVESSIRMSYETVIAMEKVAESTKQLQENAEETVEIAKLKYEVGFGADNALLKNLNLQDLSGTMVEVIAAEENLSSIETKVIEANNGLNLAKAKYLNDIGVLPYK